MVPYSPREIGRIAARMALNLVEGKTLDDPHTSNALVVENPIARPVRRPGKNMGDTFLEKPPSAGSEGLGCRLTLLHSALSHLVSIDSIRLMDVNSWICWKRKGVIQMLCKFCRSPQATLGEQDGLVRLVVQDDQQQGRRKSFEP